ncbi:forkhead box protein [Salix suchowensis]|uniref:G PATCH DOMAIN PROTEIN n=1 Tax=Salix koriyanagi TaxID=2511006 RepID=A0A9Q0TQJ2_9ROSI|nr:forkhead box protein [Salix suchowensis]KAJ6715986.1 G PATCH DOMAIN PROTEIN [Salix koriyanagi]
MAVDLHSRDSLFLPSQYNYAGEGNIPAVDKKPTNQNGPASLASSDFGSALSSPIESELGSTESESDQDDDYIAELTRQMAHHMLGDDDREKTWSFAGWPQSTAWSELGSGQEEETVMVDKFDKFKIKEEEEIHKYTDKERFSSTSLKTYPGPSSVREPEISPADQFQSKQALIENQIRLYKLKKSEQIVKQQESLYGAKRSTCYKLNDPKLQVKQFQSKGRARGGQFTSHQQQHRTGSEMRAVFLGDTCPRSGSGGGTGVFLPRGSGNTSGSQKKPGCSTVLIPARVVQALKLHFDKMGVAAGSNGAIFPIQQDASSGEVRYGLQLQQMKSQSPTMPAINCHQGTGLPQEWPY